MSTNAPLQNTVAEPKQWSNSGNAGLLLQRKCACGSPTSSLTDECKECKSKKTLGLQKKLKISEPGDVYEQEADRVADRVMKSANSDILNRSRPQVHRLSAGEAKSEEAPSIVHDVLSSSGQPLDPTDRAFFEPRLGYDFSQVRVHAGSKAAESARAVNALAYTVGQNIVFGLGQYAPYAEKGLHLLAHELTHVVQQSDGKLRSYYEPHMENRYEPVAQELAHPAQQNALSAQRTLAVHKVAGPILAKQEAPSAIPSSGATDRVLSALNRPDPIAGVGNPSEALTILGELSIDELVATLIEVDNQFMLDLLVNAIGAGDQTEVGAAIYAVRFTSSHGNTDTQFGLQAAHGLAQLPTEKQDAIIAQVLTQRSSGVTVAEIREGIEAILESESVLDAAGYEEVEDLSTPPTPPLLAGVTIGPWNPGGMPVPFYIGNSAHVAIAAEYASLHRGDAAFYNFSPISAILDAARALGIKVNLLGLRAAQLGLKPDIANLTRRHLYEIKPANLESLGAIEARIYMAAFIAAGLPFALGPMGEPGTAGTLSAPGGWFTFTAPQPGVITYRYRQPRRRRLRLRAPERVPIIDRSFMRRMQELTGLTGTALIIYIILSEGSRIAFPPRNLVPAP